MPSRTACVWVRTMAIVVISATIAFVRSNSRNAISTGMSTAVLTRATLARARALAAGAAARSEGGGVVIRGSGNAAHVAQTRKKAAMLALISSAATTVAASAACRANHRKDADGDHQDERRQAPATGLHVESSE